MVFFGLAAVQDVDVPPAAAEGAGEEMVAGTSGKSPSILHGLSYSFPS